MKEEPVFNPKSCANCQFITSEIGRVGMIPKCTVTKKRFKERARVRFQHDVDINTHTCRKFEKVQF